LQQVTSGGREIAPDDFEIHSSTQLELILGHGAGSIIGALLDAGGKSLPGSIVTLVAAGNARPVKQVADEAGDFQYRSRKRRRRVKHYDLKMPVQSSGLEVAGFPERPGSDFSEFFRCSSAAAPGNRRGAQRLSGVRTLAFSCVAWRNGKERMIWFTEI
jgi:hypothetical protein